LKNRPVVHISEVRPPLVIRALEGLVAFAIGFELKASQRHSERRLKP